MVKTVEYNIINDIMKKLIVIIAAVYALSVVSLTVAYSQSLQVAAKDSTVYAKIPDKIRFYDNFESGSVGEIKFISIDTTVTLSGDSTQHLTYNITSRKDPVNPVDSTLDPSSRWYYFLMTGVKGKSLTINMFDTDSRAPFYSYNGQKWQRYSKAEAPKTDVTTKTYERDSAYVAYYIPYTNKYLEERMQDWKYKMGVAIYSMGKSREGRDMNTLMITNTYIPDKGKVRIYMHGRVHPSESPSSWNLDGIIDYLTGNSAYAKELRNHAIFYILPFSNPDGVAHGYSRCSSSGVNLEVDYGQPDSLTEPEVKNIKNFITTTTYGDNPLAMFLNFHSQVADHVTFWVHNAETTTAEYYKDLMLFAALNIDGNKYFDKNCLSFSNMNSKYLEGFFWDNFKEKTIALTYETPYTFYNKNEEGDWVTPENLKELGIKTIWAIGDYLGIPNPDRIMAGEPDSGKGMDKICDYNYLFFGDGFLQASEDGASVKYKIKDVPEGDYAVYKWAVGENKKISNDGENQWVKLYDHRQDRMGDFVIKLDGLSAGTRADEIMLLRKE